MMSIAIGSCSRLAQPPQQPRSPWHGWPTAGGASQRGAASNVETSTHQAVVRGWMRGRGMAVLRRVAVTEHAQWRCMLTMTSPSHRCARASDR